MPASSPRWEWTFVHAIDDPMLAAVENEVPVEREDLQRLVELGFAHRLRFVRVTPAVQSTQPILYRHIEANVRALTLLLLNILVLQSEGVAQCLHEGGGQLSR